MYLCVCVCVRVCNGLLCSSGAKTRGNEYWHTRHEQTYHGTPQTATKLKTLCNREIWRVTFGHPIPNGKDTLDVTKRQTALFPIACKVWSVPLGGGCFPVTWRSILVWWHHTCSVSVSSRDCSLGGFFRPNNVWQCFDALSSHLPKAGFSRHPQVAQFCVSSTFPKLHLLWQLRVGHWASKQRDRTHKQTFVGSVSKRNFQVIKLLVKWNQKKRTSATGQVHRKKFFLVSHIVSYFLRRNLLWEFWPRTDEMNVFMARIFSSSEFCRIMCYLQRLGGMMLLWDISDRALLAWNKKGIRCGNQYWTHESQDLGGPGPGWVSWEISVLVLVQRCPGLWSQVPGSWSERETGIPRTNTRTHRLSYPAQPQWKDEVFSDSRHAKDLRRHMIFLFLFLWNCRRYCIARQPTKTRHKFLSEQLSCL